MKALRRKRAKIGPDRPPRRRRGAALLDYVLVLGAALPMVAMSYYYSTKIIRAVYQMTCALVCWPFM
jgi:hypothetical protein